MSADRTCWPSPTAENRPWTRWWWMGCAVDQHNLPRLLEAYRQAGLGGVEITSIYGVKGQDARNIEYLSPRWVEMVEFTIAEAKRLGMQVDLPPGSGWRLGGDFLTDDLAAMNLRVEEAESPSGFRAQCLPSGEPVKRPGPGGQGKAFNPFSRASVQAVIDHFTPVFERLGIRAQFHDSWEYTSDCCSELFGRFREMRGYRLEDHLAELVGEAGEGTQARVKYDVQLTLAELALEDFIEPWTQRCHELGQLSRNQAHGSPGNLLDLYAAADIPETEVFRSVMLDTPLMSKFASSAAHVAGRKLVGSETCTWLKEHFHVSLADARELADNLFVSGINHIVYHGTAYSPDDAAWPGWLFYASTQFNPQNPIWRDFGKLNEYVTRCQSILQDGQPDNDLLVYFPFHDVIHDPDRKLAALLAIEGEWMRRLYAADTFRRLWEGGYGFDYISDRQIEGVELSEGLLKSPGGTYRAIVVPPCRFMPAETLKALAHLKSKGAAVVFLSPAPGDVPGLERLDERRKSFAALMSGVEPRANVEAAMTELGIMPQLTVADADVAVIRRRCDAGRYYFVVNQGAKPIDGWATLGSPCESALLMDPMSGCTGRAEMQRRDNTCEVRIQLDPGGSCVLRTFDCDVVDAPAWGYIATAGPAQELRGTWRVEFTEGGPELPPSFETPELSSWSGQGGAAERFAGTALYRLTFDAPSADRRWLLDLGEVHASARVRLNGSDVATLIGPSFRTCLTDLRPSGNVLEVEVINLAANRIRDLDRRGVEWRIFEDINFVSRDYKPFDASQWPLVSSGLLGPVRLTPLES
jgi:glycosyl hydrolase family 106( putative alpha-L-rhamnosidase)